MNHRNLNRTWGFALTAALLLGGAILPTGAQAAGRGAGGGDGLLNALLRGASNAVDNAVALLPLSVPSLTTSPLSTTRTIDGAQGGVVSAGRFTVIVPPGAFMGSGNVTVSVPNPAMLECELTVEPAELNRFDIPVTLTVDGANVNSNSPFSLKLGWWDPALAKWTPVSGSSEDNLTLRVSAPLGHFSKYGCFDGKAGW